MDSKKIGTIVVAVVAVLIAVFVIFHTVQGDQPSKSFTPPRETADNLPKPQAMQGGAPSPNDLANNPEATGTGAGESGQKYK